MGDAPPLDEDAPDEALLAEDGRSSPTSVGRVRKRAQIGAQLARGWERGVALLRRRLARSCCCLQTRSGSTSARLRGWGGETMLAGTRIPHHPHVRAHHAAIPPHSQAPSPSDAATPSGGLADDERDEAAAPPGWPARASRWPVQRLRDRALQSASEAALPVITYRDYVFLCAPTLERRRRVDLFRMRSRAGALESPDELRQVFGFRLKERRPVSFASEREDIPKRRI